MTALRKAALAALAYEQALDEARAEVDDADAKALLLRLSANTSHNRAWLEWLDDHQRRQAKGTTSA